MNFSRRQLLKTTIASATASMAVSGCSQSSETTSNTVLSIGTPSVNDLLDQTTELILNAYPESTSSMGIDVGQYSAHKSRLTDRSLAGQAKIKSEVKEMLDKLNEVDTSTLMADQALNIDVVRTVFEMSAKGFNQAYGDMALLNSNLSKFKGILNSSVLLNKPSFKLSYLGG